MNKLCKRIVTPIAALLILSLTATAQVTTITKQNWEVSAKIRTEGLENSQAMQTAFHLTSIIGPRLTGSPGMKRAREWTQSKLNEWGLKNVHQESWGPFGRGWSVKQFSARVTAPQAFELIAYPKAWSPGTSGPITGNVVYVDAIDEKELEKYRGKLKGAIVLYTEPRQLEASFKPLAERYDDKELLLLANRADLETEQAYREVQRKIQPPQQSTQQMGMSRSLKARLFYPKKIQFLVDEGAAAALEVSRDGDGGTVITEQAITPLPFDASPTAAFDGSQPNVWDKNPPKNLPQITIAAEHYNRMVKMLSHGEKIEMTLDAAVQFHEEDLMGYNVIAEIPGTDPKLKDEVVMLGAHLDSWHTATGATDNAAGCAVMMEAVRILQKLDLKPRRTIRIALWEGEEEGLLGSRAYVNKYFGFFGDGDYASINAARRRGETLKLTTKPDYDKISAYFNLDNGGGKIRGWRTNGNEALQPIFRQWLMPFSDFGASTVSDGISGGTDHVPFYQIGIPGFQPIQDWLEYWTRSNHSNVDTFDRLQEDDLKQSSIIMAAFVYNTAMMDEKLPRRAVN